MRKIILLWSVLFLTSINFAQNGFEFPEINGLAKEGKLKIYLPENLWDLIDGAADSFLKYDFEKLYLQRYSGGNNKLLKIEIYHHSNHINAFGKYTNEMPYESTWMEIGAEGYYEPGMLNFYKGNCYVKISSFNMKKDSVLIRNTAEKIAGLITGSVEPPLLSTKFPSESKVQNSERFVNRDYLGYSQLNGVFTAEYEDGDRYFNMFIISKKSEEDVKEMVANYVSAIEGKDIKLNTGITKIDDPYQGRLFVKLLGIKLIGTVNLEDRKTASKYLGLLEKSLN